jgi:hypothetical protein
MEVTVIEKQGDLYICKNDVFKTGLENMWFQQTLFYKE